MSFWKDTSESSHETELMREYLLSLNIPKEYHRCHIHIKDDDYDPNMNYYNFNFSSLYKKLRKQVLSWTKKNEYPEVDENDLVEGNLYCIVGKTIHANDVIIIKFQKFMGYIREQEMFGELVWADDVKQQETPYLRIHGSDNDDLCNYDYSGIQNYGFEFTCIKCIDFPSGIKQRYKESVRFFELPLYSTVPCMK
jgi:hypothetical protein